MSRRLKKIIIIDIIIAAVIVAMIGVYLGTYYHADETALGAVSDSSNVFVSNLKLDGNLNAIAFIPEEPRGGLVFYPENRVQYEAYAPLMQALASRGIACMLVKMPCNMASLNVDAAEGLPAYVPEVTNWYIGGHGAGATAAAKYLAENTMNYEGIVLLGGYSNVDLTGTGLGLLSIYGSEDKVMSMKNYEAKKENITDNLTEHVIEGGCHSYFGMYGMQKGDGEPAISNQEQIDETAAIIAAFMSC